MRQVGRYEDGHDVAPSRISKKSKLQTDFIACARSFFNPVLDFGPFTFV